MKRNKSKNFGAKKVYYDGYTFDSQKEFEDYLILKGQLSAGLITRLEVHVKYKLIPGIYHCNQTGIFRFKEPGVKLNGAFKWVCIQRAVTYTADFVIHYPDGSYKVLDSKPKMKTEKQRKFFESSNIFKGFRKKQKLMKQILNIDVEII